MGLALHADLDYALVRDTGLETKGGYAILLCSKVAEFLGCQPDINHSDTTEVEILAVARGRELAGLEYEPLFNYFANFRAEGAFRSHCADFVSAEDGCGIVHCAPGFGEEDYKLLHAAGVPVVVPVDQECRYTDEIPEFAGQFVRDANKNVRRHLEAAGLVFKHEQILHSYLSLLAL